MLAPIQRHPTSFWGGVKIKERRERRQGKGREGKEGRRERETVNFSSTLFQVSIYGVHLPMS